jgi:hypothetical protein
VVAANAFNLEALLDSFSESALINDKRGEYREKIAIKKRAADDIVGDIIGEDATDVCREDHGTL